MNLKKSEICISNLKNFEQKLLLVGLSLYAIASNCSIAAAQTGLSLAFIALLLMLKKGKIEVLDSPINRSFALFALTGFFAIFNAENTIRALMGMRLYLLIAVFFLAFWPNYSEKTQRYLLTLFVAFSAIVAFLSTIKFINYDIANGLPRAQGFFSMPLTFGETMSMSTLVSLTWLCVPSKSKLKNPLLTIAIILTLLCIVLSGTRGAWLGFAAGLLVLFVKMPQKMLLPLIVVSLTSFWLINQFIEPDRGIASLSIKQNIEAFQKKEDISTENIKGFETATDRMRIWQLGFEILAKQPVFGTGIKNVKSSYARLVSIYNYSYETVYGHQHNIFMQQMLSLGIWGLIAFIYFLLSLLALAQNASVATSNGQNSEEFSSQIAKGALPVLVCFLVAGLTEDVWGDQEVSMMVLFCVGFLANRAKLIL